MKILIVLTSHDAPRNSGESSGFRLEELAVPYYAFADAGLLITLASPKGGRPAVASANETDTPHLELTRRFDADAKAQAALGNTVPLGDVLATDFEAVFYAGGHGSLWDLAEDPASIGLVEAMLGTPKPCAFVGHAPGVLRHARNPEGLPFFRDKDVTSFADSEDAAAGLTDLVPFSVETMLREDGGRYTKAADGEPLVVTDGMLITAQNTASSELAARAVIKKLNFFSAPGFVVSIPWNVS